MGSGFRRNDDQVALQPVTSLDHGPVHVLPFAHGNYMSE